jgi:hypothetical protein
MTSGVFGTDAPVGRHYFAPIRGLDHRGRRSEGVALGCHISHLRCFVELAFEHWRVGSIIGGVVP